MDGLTNADLRGVLDCIERIHGPSNLDEFASLVVKVLPGIVRSEQTAYNEVNPALRRLGVVVDRPGWMTPDGAEAFERNQDDHPLLRHAQQTGDRGARKVSDFLTHHEFHKTGIYNELYRGLGCEDQMAVTLSLDADTVVALAFNRGRCDFSERDRKVLNVLRPHLAQAYQTAAVASDLRHRCDLLGATLDQLGEAVVVLGSRDRICWMTAPAARWLASYFPGRRASVALPDPVRQWLAAQRSPHRAGKLPAPREPLVIQGLDRRLTLRLLTGDAFQQPLLLLHEQCETFAAEPLLTLGLTHREAEVLWWISRGKTNPQIAITLHASSRTIQKHAENIFRKLGVETRTMAATRAIEAMNLQGRADG